MDKELNLLRERLAQLEARVQQLESIQKIPQALAPPVPRPAAQPVLSRPPPPPPPPVHPPIPGESWEQKIGGTWLYRIGVVALLIGLAFFLKFAFDNDWINELGRVAIGYLAGGLLLAAGFWYRGRGGLPKFGSGLGGAGIGAWFITTWAAFNYYQLFAQTPAFIVMAGVTVAGMALAIWWDSPSIAGLGLLGGYLTPLLIPGAGGHMALFTYLLILNLGILTVLVKKNWNGLAYVSLGFTVILYGFSMVAMYDVTQLPVFMGFLTAYHLLFALQGLAANLVHRSPVKPGLLGVAIMSGGFYALFSALLLFGNYRNTLAIILLIWGVFYLVQMAAVRRWRADDTNLSWILLSLALGYITLAIPILFSDTWVTMAWIIQAAVLIVIGWRSNAVRVRAWGLLVLGLALWRLITLDLAVFAGVNWLLRDGYISPWTGRMPAVLLAVSLLLLTSWLYRRQKSTRRGLVPALIVAADILVLIFILGEWSRWFYHLRETVAYNWQGLRATAWTLTMAGNLTLLLVLWHRWRYRPLQTLALTLLPIAMFWSIFFDIRLFSRVNFHTVYLSPFAGRLPAAFLVAVLGFAATRLFASDQTIGRGKKMLLGWISATANLLILGSVLRELDRYYFVHRTALAQPWQVFRNTTWSAAMSVHGFVLVALGVWRKYPLLRRLGLALLLLTVTKITLVDLSGLETIWRILVFLGTGAILILVSWVYQRFVVQLEN